MPPHPTSAAARQRSRRLLMPRVRCDVPSHPAPHRAGLPRGSLPACHLDRGHLLVTGRYPLALFGFNLGVLRWNRRVGSTSTRRWAPTATHRSAWPAPTTPPRVSNCPILSTSREAWPWSDPGRRGFALIILALSPPTSSPTR